jgi:hypothetical protein
MTTVRRAAAKERPMGDHDDEMIIDIQAMLELTDAHVSPAADGAWDAAVADAHHEAEEATATHEAGFDALVDVALAFG